MSMLSRQFGIAEPVRRGMEMQIVQGGAWRPSLLGGSLRDGGVHGDILSGRDCEVGWEDVFVGEYLYLSFGDDGECCEDANVC